MNMMGKCVNFVVWLVIFFDLYLGMSEIGVFSVFVKKFMFFEFVILYNVDLMCIFVENGFEIYLGVNVIEDE